MNLRIIIFFMALFIMHLCYANNTQIENIIENIFYKASTSINKIDGEKAYLNPEKICLDHGRIYIEDNDGNAMLIPLVFYDEPNLFLPIKYQESRETLYICSNCSWTHYYLPKRCEKCHLEAGFIVRYR